MFFVLFVTSLCIKTASISKKYLNLTGYVKFVRLLDLAVSIYHALYAVLEEEPWNVAIFIAKIINVPKLILNTRDISWLEQGQIGDKKDLSMRQCAFNQIYRFYIIILKNKLTQSNFQFVIMYGPIITALALFQSAILKRFKAI